MPESLKTRLMRWGFNLYPAYRGTGARITHIAADWREVRPKLPLESCTFRSDPTHSFPNWIAFDDPQITDEDKAWRECPSKS